MLKTFVLAPSLFHILNTRLSASRTTNVYIIEVTILTGKRTMLVSRLHPGADLEWFTV